MNKKILFALILILAVSFAVRLYKIDNPIADWHSWRQADTAVVARNFYKYGYNPFLPKYDDMSGVAENPVPNPGRYRFVEFPIYNSTVYLAYALNGGVREELARLITVFISLGSLVMVYLLSRRYFGEKTALLSALLFGILPYSIYYSRVILPDPLLVFASLGFLYFLDGWIWQNKSYQLIWGLIFLAMAFLTKPMAIFYFLPLVYSYYKKEGKFWPIPKRYWVIALGFIPFLGWRVWIQQHPEGIPASKWLFNGNGIRFRPAFFQWIVGDRFGTEILGVTGTFLFLLGVLKRPFEKEGWLLYLLALSSIAYLFVFATGNVQHDYYQILIIPALCIFLARGAVLLFRGIEGFVPRIWTIPLALLFLFLAIYLPWLDVKGLYQINNPVIVEAGREADAILPKSAVVIAPYNGDTSFLYQTNRYGWAFVAMPIPEMIKRFGVTSFVSVAEDAQTKWVERNYSVLEKTPGFVIVDLTKPNMSANPLMDPEPK
ncbi:MAG: ArnT family glycosyltransferase [Candidatus Paceibacterales bacterium]